MRALRDFHSWWGYVAIVANALAGMVALAAWRVPRLRGRHVWVAAVAAEIALMVQVVAGVMLVSAYDLVAPRFHMFYGYVAFITVGLAYSYRAQMKGRVELLYGLVGLFLMGVGIRAVLQIT